MTSETVTNVIQSIRGHRERFERLCRSLSAEELALAVPESTWSVKDFIIHLATLDIELVRWFDGVGAGRLDAGASNADGSPFILDDWNEIEVSKRRGQLLDEIFEEAARNREKLIECLERLEDAQIEQVVHFNGDNKRDPANIQFKMFLLGWARHDPIHVADMVKAMPERADDPEIVAWLNDPAVKWYQNAMAGPAKR